MLAHQVLPSEPTESDQVDVGRDPASLQVARAGALAQSGYLSRAAKTLTQQGLVAPSPDVVEKLLAVDEALLRKLSCQS